MRAPCTWTRGLTWEDRISNPGSEMYARAFALRCATVYGLSPVFFCIPYFRLDGRPGRRVCTHYCVEYARGSIVKELCTASARSAAGRIRLRLQRAR